MISASKPAISVILADSNTFVPSDLSEGIERATRLLLVAFSGKVHVTPSRRWCSRPKMEPA